MNFVADLHKGVQQRDLGRLKVAYNKSQKLSGVWPDLQDLYERFDSADADNNIFFLLYQDLKLRRKSAPKSWSEKLAIYHNFGCLIGELINLNFALPSEWLWDILAAMVNSYVACTNDKWVLLKSSANLGTLDESELRTFRELYDFDFVEDLLVRLEGAMDRAGQADDQENLAGRMNGDAECSPVPCSDVSRAALIKLYGAVGKPYKTYLENLRLEALPVGARSLINYAQCISTMTEGNFNLPKESAKYNKNLCTFCDYINESTVSTDAKDFLRNSLRPMCSKCDFSDDCVQENVRDDLVEKIWTLFLSKRQSETYYAYARIYRNVKIGALANLAGTNDIKCVREALLSYPHVEIVDDVVHVSCPIKQDSRVEIFQRQTLRAQELMTIIQNL